MITWSKTYWFKTWIDEPLETNNAKNCLEMMKKVEMKNNFGLIDTLEVRSFVSFAQLDFECLESENHYIDEIYMLPDQLLILNKSFRISLMYKSKLNISIYIRFMNIKGFDVQSTIFKDFLAKNNLKFYHSELASYQNGTKITNCTAQTNSSIFLNSNFIIFSNTVKYNKDICPLIFNHLDLKRLEFNGITHTFYKNNQLGFVDHNIGLNLKLKKLSLIAWRY
ncbi:hypothetical protein BpHYR1_010803 [Brachionus plicatilis]|uniref:Uncharacterized protein n=1 Tax=Brachionus plicatilis TaxID=10195 RepID=A0A3M7PGQ8_BRAPC|nr:hypothetical protein BpHYR1_010803 [Brachionus plicatilis]